MKLISEQYPNNYLYYIVSINNLQSILTNGILSRNSLSDNKDFKYEDISNLSVQNRRDLVYVTEVNQLHDYANLYFNPRNAMLYSKLDQINNLCILRIDKIVLDISSTVVSDRNAAKALVSFMTPKEALRELNFKKIYQKYWNHPDFLIKEENKALMMAEVLVLHKIDPNYIVEILVPNEIVKQKIENLGIQIPIQIENHFFFQ